jgi:hypothetical protein
MFIELLCRCVSFVSYHQSCQNNLQNQYSFTNTQHVNGEKRHWSVINAIDGIMHHVQGSTHKNTQDLQTHLFPGIA